MVSWEWDYWGLICYLYNSWLSQGGGGSCEKHINYFWAELSARSDLTFFHWVKLLKALLTKQSHMEAKVHVKLCGMT